MPANPRQTAWVSPQFVNATPKPGVVALQRRPRMLYRTLPALLATALWTTAFSPAIAAGKPDKKTPAKGAPAAASVSSMESEVVGSVNGKPVMTFGQVVSKFQKTSPPLFAAAVGQAIGQQATVAFFG